MLSNINYVPLPSLKCGSLVVSTSDNGEEEYLLEIDSDGFSDFVDGSENKFGVKTSLSEYTILLSPLSEGKKTPISESSQVGLKPMSLNIQENKLEYFYMPNLFESTIDVNNFYDISSSDALKISGASSPATKVGLNNPEVEDFFSESFLKETPDNFAKNNGLISFNIIPEIFQSEYNFFGEINRPEVYFSKDNSFSQDYISSEWHDFLKLKNLSNASILTQSIRPNFLEKKNDNFIGIPSAYIQKKLEEVSVGTKNVSGKTIIQIPIEKSLLNKKYIFKKPIYFSVYLVDKYGQYVKNKI